MDHPWASCLRFQSAVTAATNSGLRPFDVAAVAACCQSLRPLTTRNYLYCWGPAVVAVTCCSANAAAAVVALQNPLPADHETSANERPVNQPSGKSVGSLT